MIKVRARVKVTVTDTRGREIVHLPGSMLLLRKGDEWLLEQGLVERLKKDQPKSGRK